MGLLECLCATKNDAMNQHMKYCFLIFLLNLGLIRVFAQLDSCILISTKDFEGTIIQENYLIDISPDNSGNLRREPIEWINLSGVHKWTPTEKIIFDFETSLSGILTSYKPKDDYEKSDVEYILEDLVNYKRQYIGFLDSLNNQCLWINFYKSNVRLKEPDKRIATVFGGGANYFTLWINLTDKKIIGLVINGPI